MNLLQIRQKFRELSGRFDLVNEDGSDNGADFFINEGRKYLDGLDETNRSFATSFQKLEADRIGVTFEGCRALQKVWLTKSGSRVLLEKMDPHDLILDYLSGTVTAGTPAYFALYTNRYFPEDLTMDKFEVFLPYMEISMNPLDQNCILFNCPADEDMYLIINGLFYSSYMATDEAENHWSVNHPMLLIMAAMRQVEVINRNTQGVGDWERSINKEVELLGKDLVEEMIVDVDHMED